MSAHKPVPEASLPAMLAEAVAAGWKALDAIPLAGRHQGVTDEQIDALIDYAASNGRRWKTKLHADWMDARTEGHLQVIRNTLGPSWLIKFNLNKAKEYRGR